MDLILWRHAEAEPGEPDLGRRLTAKGLKQGYFDGSKYYGENYYGYLQLAKGVSFPAA